MSSNYGNHYAKMWVHFWDKEIVGLLFNVDYHKFDKLKILCLNFKQKKSRVTFDNQANFFQTLKAEEQL